MALYVTLSEDKFGPISKSISDGFNSTEIANYSVRRPLHGMDLPEDTYASITVRSSSGKPLTILANTADSVRSSAEMMSSKFTTNLIVQRIDENRQEKQQIIETFGEDFVFYYGQRPRILSVTAILPDSDDFQYAQEFWTNYDRALRGTRLVARDARVFLTVAGQVFEGYLSTAQTSRSADQPRIVQLTFQMYITHSYYIQNLKYYKVGSNPTDVKPYRRANKGDFIVLVDEPKGLSLDQTQNTYRKRVKKVTDLLLKSNPLVGLSNSLEVDVYRVMDISMDFPVSVNSLNSPSLETISRIKTPGATSRIGRFRDFLGQGLSIIGGGLIVAGAASAVLDDIQSFDGNFLDYLNDRIIQPIVDEAYNFAEDTVDIAGSLVSAGYSIVEPNRSISQSETLAFVDRTDLITQENPDPTNDIILQDSEDSLPPAETMLYITESSGNIRSSNPPSDIHYSIYDDSVMGADDNNILNEVIGL